MTTPSAPAPRSVANRIGLALRLLAVFLWDIVVSNFAVAKRILGPESAIRPRFVWVPLTLRGERLLATYAGMITMTPGTLSVDISADHRWLLVHAFDVDDEAELRRSLHERYERPLMEIFP